MIAELSMHDAVRWLGRELGGAGFRAWDVKEDGVRYTRVTEGIGWCQPAGAGTESWPPGALGCLRVFWYPDPVYQRDYRKKTIPAGAAEHWQTSTEALLAVLHGLGLGAARTGPPRTPDRHSFAALLVWEPGPDTPAEWPPPGAWEGVPPTRPNFVDGWPGWKDRGPGDEVSWALRDLARQREAEGRTKTGRVSVADHDGVLWPPGAHACACVHWHPDKEHVRAADGSLSAAAFEHWCEGTSRLQDDLAALGYESRTAWTHPAEVRDFAVVLAWRGARSSSS
ncbi:hypothetical protein [Kitasatospora sp. NPDC059803]|uniref:hypothetical protein n=1 Tax=Kitasatospora sp. NPDC059803 TaxID=3346953 RepID=UPI000A7E5CB5